MAALPRADVLTLRVASSPAFLLFQIHHSAALGRHAVATADLAAGKGRETILDRF